MDKGRYDRTHVYHEIDIINLFACVSTIAEAENILQNVDQNQTIRQTTREQVK